MKGVPPAILQGEKERERERKKERMKERERESEKRARSQSGKKEQKCSLLRSIDLIFPLLCLFIQKQGNIGASI
jgi:hypothetical protein